MCDIFSRGYRKLIKLEYRENGDVVVFLDYLLMNYIIYVKIRFFNLCSLFKRDLYFIFLFLFYKMFIECNDNY